MAQTTLVPVVISRPLGDDPLAGGQSPTHATEGFLFPNGGQTFLYIVNANIGAVVVTFDTPQKIAGLDVDNFEFTVPASSTRVIGPFPRDTFNVQSGANRGHVSAITDANGTDLTIHAYLL